MIKKDICKLIVKCLLVLVPFWGILAYTAFNPLSYLPSSTIGAYWNKLYTTTSHDEPADVVILGDSLAVTGFLPELLSDGTIDLGIAGSSPVEGYIALRNYLENNQAPTDVFVTYMDYHLAQDSIAWKQVCQVNALSWDDYKEIKEQLDITEGELDTDIPIDDYWKDALGYKLYLPSKYITSILNSFTDDRASNNRELFARYDTLMGRTGLVTTDYNAYVDTIVYDTFKVSRLCSHYYKKIFDLCQENDIKLHILKMPMTSTTGYTKQYMAQINGYYMTMTEGYDNIDFVFYQEPYAIEYFLDEYHMNQYGAKAFALQLKEEYPDLFGDYSATARQMQAIDFDLLVEKYPRELFKWIDQKDYTVFLYDKLNGSIDMQDAYNVFLCIGDQKLSATDSEGTYYVTGDGKNLSVNLPQVEDKTFDQPGIRIVIVNNKSGELVLDKYTSYDVENDKLSDLQ